MSERIQEEVRRRGLIASALFISQIAGKRWEEGKEKLCKMMGRLGTYPLIITQLRLSDVACIERVSDMTRRLGQMKTMEICTWIEICTKE